MAIDDPNPRMPYQLAMPSEAQSDIVIPSSAIVGELALCLWLLIKGVNVPQAPRTTATLHPARAAA